MDKSRRSELKQAYKNRTPEVGVFQIKNKVNGKIFLGSSPSLDKAFNRHLLGLKIGSHPNKELQKEWNQYGEESFIFEVIDRIKPNEDPLYNYSEDLKTLEEMWLDKLEPYGEKGYNKKKTNNR